MVRIKFDYLDKDTIVQIINESNRIGINAESFKLPLYYVMEFDTDKRNIHNIEKILNKNDVWGRLIC